MTRSRVLERLADPGRFPSGVFGFLPPDADGGPLGSFSELGSGLRFGCSGNPFSRRTSSSSCSIRLVDRRRSCSFVASS